jgi:ferric-dicitrate binding protein FerR (iron transport regulator)
MTERKKLYELLVKDLASEISEEEKKLLEKDLSINQEQKNNTDIIKRFWYSYFPKTGENNIIEKTEKKLGFTYQQKNKSNNKGFVFKVAATFLIALSLGIIGFYSLKLNQNEEVQITEYKSSPDEIKKVVLSDGTRVWLNTSSVLITVEPFSGDNREVRLIGEGYFEVAHNPEKPFLVKTTGLTTKVLGTHFNIISYPGETNQKITLYEGKVELIDENSIKNNVVIHPGEQARFDNQQGKFLVQETDLGLPAVWRDGILRFYDEELNQIAITLERKFRTKILIKDEKAGKLRYTANFEEESLIKILQLLDEAHEFEFYETNNGIIIESYKMQK